MNTPEIVLWWTLAVLTVVSAVVAIARRNALHCAMGFIVTLASIAGLFWILDSRVVAILQVLIYAGAIVTLLVFVIMLLNQPEDRMPLDRGAIPWIVVALIVSAIMAGIVNRAAGPAPARPDVLTYDQSAEGHYPPEGGLAVQQMNAADRVVLERRLFGSLRQMSGRLFGAASEQKGDAEWGPFMLAFEILSLPLLVAAVGAVLLTKRNL